MLKVMAFLVKRQGLDTDDLIDYYETHHVPLILSLAPAPVTYKRNYLLRTQPPEARTISNIVTESVSQTVPPIEAGVGHVRARIWRR